MTHSGMESSVKVPVAVVRSLPQLPTNTTDRIEVCIYGNESMKTSGSSGIELLEIYIYM